MAGMVKWSGPWGDLASLRQEMNRIFEDALPGWGGERGLGTWFPRGDIVEEDERYRAVAEVPGLAKEDISISLDGNVLTISGEKKRQEADEGADFHRVERRWGKFSRSFSLPAEVDADSVEATYSQGVLEVVLPKSAEAKPRRIAIKKG